MLSRQNQNLLIIGGIATVATVVYYINKSSKSKFDKKFKENLVKEYENKFDDYIYEIPKDKLNHELNFVLKQDININDDIIIPQRFICDLNSNIFCNNKKDCWILYLIHDWFYALHEYQGKEISKSVADEILEGYEKFFIQLDNTISSKNYENSYKDYKNKKRTFPENIFHQLIYTKPRSGDIAGIDDCYSRVK